MDITAIGAAVSSLKAATDITRSLVQMKTMSDVQGKVIELQSALLDAQQSALDATNAQHDLVEKVRRLEAQITAMNDWRAEKARYQLVNPWRGSGQAYALKREASDGEPPHYLCANCFRSGKPSPLNPVIERDGFVEMVCPTCRAKSSTGYRGIGAAKYAEDYAAEPPKA